MSHTVAFNNLVRSLYLASAGLEDINQSLRHACRLFNSHTVGVLSTKPTDLTSRMPFAVGISKYQRENYRNNFAQKDILIDACLADMMAGYAVSSADYFTVTELKKSSFYNEFLKGLGLFHNAGFIFGLRDGFVYTLIMGREAIKHRFTGEEKRYMYAAKPHFEAALHINSLVNLLKLENQTKSSAIDRLTVGVCFLTKELRVTEANLIARQALNAGEFLRSKNGYIKLGRNSSPRLQKLLHMMIHGMENSCRIKLNNKAGNATCFLSVFPVLDSNDLWWIDSQETRYVIFIGSELTPTKHCKSFLAMEFGLTLREVELAALLLRGSGLKETAHYLHISHETARSHLKSIFMKMDIHSQSQLAVTVSRLNSVH